ncbi:MAG: hypothetical protein HGA96_17165 [Desulfobulbaceae bacterium]|nr:hypothetical protein [Desulfobulbaceae bacterium]
MKQTRQQHRYLIIAAISLICSALFASSAGAATVPCNPGLICNSIYAPVCGADGQTYPNACEAARYCADIIYNGVCGAPSPLCRDIDQDGYSATGGICGPIDCNDYNPTINPGVVCMSVRYAPVCGVDGITYDNACDANQACVEIAYDGVCVQPPICLDVDLDGYSSTGGSCGPVDCNDNNPAVNPGVICPYYYIYTPVCGVDGNTYDSACEATQVCVAIAHEGACVQPPVCLDADRDGYSPMGGPCGPADCNDSDPTINPGMACTTLYAPVCGMNGTTYSNECVAKQACMVIAHNGECVQQPTCTDSDHDTFAVEGGLCGDKDCDDFDPAINPFATEIPGNNIDENCNGMTDDIYIMGANNDPATEGTCGGYGTYITTGMCTPQAMGQEFVASENNLVAVELLLKNSNGVPASIVINIRENSLAGQIIGSATYVSDPVSAAKNWQGWAHFEFAAPVSLIAGNVYVIELLHTTATSTAWYWLANDHCVPPVSGFIVCNKVRSADSFYFRTFAEEIIDDDQDGFSPPDDCNDTDAAINPAAQEIPYNGVDENCNGQADDTDFDKDGYPFTQDCDDSDPAINPGMMCTSLYAPVCGVDGNTYANSCEADQACVAVALAGACPPPCTDNDLDGFAIEGGECGPVDCNDNNAAAHPGATEIKNNQVDENCNGMGDDLQVLPVITKAEYNQKERELTVTATSQLGAKDALVVKGFGAMTWDRRKSRWTLSVRKLAATKAPATVTVTGFYGSATVNTTRTR